MAMSARKQFACNCTVGMGRRHATSQLTYSTGGQDHLQTTLYPCGRWRARPANKTHSIPS